MSRSVRAVLLDAGNTLVFVDPDKVLSAFRAEGIEADRETYTTAEREARLAFVAHLGEDTRGTESAVWRRYFLTLFRACGVPEAAAARVGERIKRLHDEEHLWTHVQEGTDEALATLRERGFRLGVVSNSDGRIDALLRQKGIHHHFDVVLDSGAVGVEKPDPAIFHMALEGLDGIEPGETLYVGDLYPVDVVGARAAGLQALLVDPYDAFLERDVERIRSVRELPDWLDGAGGGEV